MFSSSFAGLRVKILAMRSISTLMQIGYNSFPEMNSKVAKACATSLMAARINDFVGKFVDLNSAPQSADKNKVFIERNRNLDYSVLQSDFVKIPGNPISYWASDTLKSTFIAGPPISDLAGFRAGVSTGDNSKFQRYWHEVGQFNTKLGSTDHDADAMLKWFPCNSGAPFRKWYGNNELVIDWEEGGCRIKAFPGSAVRNEDTFFKVGITYTKISSGRFSARYKPSGFVYDDTGRSVFCVNETETLFALGLLCSEVANAYLSVLAPGMSFTSAELGRIPVLELNRSAIGNNVERLITIAREDWDSHEISWDFGRLSLLENGARTLAESWLLYSAHAGKLVAETQRRETDNNRLFIAAYGLQDELSPEVPEDQITLARSDREKDCQRLTSYAIGCMMGRYSLDEPGLIYAHAGNVDFDPGRYKKKFPADADGIVPLTNERWFDDDAASRVREFLGTVWGNAIKLSESDIMTSRIQSQPNSLEIDNMENFQNLCQHL